MKRPVTCGDCRHQYMRGSKHMCYERELRLWRSIGWNESDDGAHVVQTWVEDDVQVPALGVAEGD